MADDEDDEIVACCYFSPVLFVIT